MFLWAYCVLGVEALFGPGTLVEWGTPVLGGSGR